jgi:hypothetical protein
MWGARFYEALIRRTTVEAVDVSSTVQGFLSNGGEMRTLLVDRGAGRVDHHLPRQHRLRAVERLRDEDILRSLERLHESGAAECDVAVTRGRDRTEMVLTWRAADRQPRRAAASRGAGAATAA